MTTAMTSAQIMANLFVSHSQALALSAHNAALQQQQGNLLMQSITSQGIKTINIVGKKAIVHITPTRKHR